MSHLVMFSLVNSSWQCGKHDALDRVLGDDVHQTKEANSHGPIVGVYQEIDQHNGQLGPGQREHSVELFAQTCQCELKSNHWMMGELSGLEFFFNSPA